jgi:hypothetical protein
MAVDSGLQFCEDIPDFDGYIHENDVPGKGGR